MGPATASTVPEVFVFPKPTTIPGLRREIGGGVDVVIGVCVVQNTKLSKIRGDGKARHVFVILIISLE